MNQYEIARRWKVVASRSYHWGHKIMKPGQIFTAAEKDLPMDFRSKVVPLDLMIQTQQPPVQSTQNDLEETVVPDIPEPLTYRVKERASGEWYDIFDSKNKKVNEHKLTKEEAEAFVKNLTA